MNPIGFLVLISWSIIGLLFWLPVLARAIAVYFVFVTAAAVTGQKTKGLGSILDDATTFYVRGFKRIIESFDEDDSPREALPIGKLLLECVWAILFWTVLAFSFMGTARLERWFFRLMTGRSAVVETPFTAGSGVMSQHKTKSGPNGPKIESRSLSAPAPNDRLQHSPPGQAQAWVLTLKNDTVATDLKYRMSGNKGAFVLKPGQGIYWTGYSPTLTISYGLPGNETQQSSAELNMTRCKLLTATETDFETGAHYAFKIVDSGRFGFARVDR